MMILKIHLDDPENPSREILVLRKRPCGHLREDSRIAGKQQATQILSQNGSAKTQSLRFLPANHAGIIRIVRLACSGRERKTVKKVTAEKPALQNAIVRKFSDSVRF